MSLHPSVAAVRVAVRRTLAELVAEQPGSTLPRTPPCWSPAPAAPDSLALLAATVFEGHKARAAGDRRDRRPRPPGGVGRARRRTWSRRWPSWAPTRPRPPGSRSQGGGRGPEAAAREARYAVLDQMVQHFGAIGVLLGHTLDDQAETVLLGLARGSGGRSLAGHAPPLRPLPPPAARRDPHRHGDRLPGRGDRVLERPAQHRPRLRPGPGAPQGAAGARGRARPRRGRRPGPHRRPAPRRHGAARPARAGRRTTTLREPEPGSRSRRSPTCRRATRHRVLRLAALDAGAIASELFHVHVVALGAAGGGARRRRRGAAARPRDGVPLLGRARTGGCGSGRPLCKADRHGRCRRRVRPRRGSLHRGPDPGAARRAGPPDRGRLRRQGPAASSASCAAR